MSASSAFSIQNNKTVRKFAKIRTITNSGILDDIRFVLEGIKKAGLKRAIIVDLTNPDIGIPVVRAIVPGLETFDITNSIMGERARNYYNNLNLYRH